MPPSIKSEHSGRRENCEIKRFGRTRLLPSRIPQDIHSRFPARQELRPTMAAGQSPACRIVGLGGLRWREVLPESTDLPPLPRSWESALTTRGRCLR